MKRCHPILWLLAVIALVSCSKSNEVDENANLANWAVPGKPLLGVGGAMDLASGAKKLIITMTHTNSDGSSKIVPLCSLPLTAMNAVDMIITDLAVFTFKEKKLTLIELMPGVKLEEVRSKTRFSSVSDFLLPTSYFRPPTSGLNIL